MTTLRSQNGNCVAALQPAPGDLFAVTLLGGRVVFVQPADDYEKALRLAEAFADQVTPPGGHPFTVKVLGATLGELLAFAGIDRQQFTDGIMANETEWRGMAVDACKRALRDSNEAGVRRDAFDLLTEMEAIQP